MDRRPSLRSSILAVYSLALAGGNILLGALILIGGDPRMSASSFANLRSIASPTAWGFMLVVAGCLIVVGHIFNLRGVVFWGHVFAGGVSLFWAAVFLAGARDTPTSPWTGIAAYLQIAVQHYLTAGMTSGLRLRKRRSNAQR